MMEDIETLKGRCEQLEVENKRLKDTLISLGNIVKEKKKMWEYCQLPTA